MTTKRNLLGDALHLASLGLRVFPLNGKTPIGGRGCLDATTNTLQIESWWERYPKANIGLATGHGIAVVDVDVRRDGATSLRHLVTGRKRDFKTVAAKSGGGGRHFFFGVKKDMWVPNSKDRIGRGIEVLYDGRYVVAPPSVHPITGNTYEWLRPPDDSECLLIPRWLAEMNAEKSGQQSWDKYVEEIKEGEGRNNHLASYAGSLRRGGATQGEIYDALVARNTRVCNPPLSTKELMTIAKSISRYKPEDVMVGATLDDAGNAKRLADYASGAAIFVPGVGWHAWSGRRWAVDEENLRIQHMAKHIGREMRRAAADIRNGEQSEKLYKWGSVCGNYPRIRAMMSLAADEPSLKVPVSQLDQGAFRINLINGTFDLRKNELLPHNADDKLTRMARVEFDPEAECPLWDQFTREVLPQRSVRDYVQRAIGYSLTGSNTEQCFFMMYGAGSNGKSTFIEMLHHLLGDYAWKMASETVMGGYRATGAATPDVVMLRGPRFVVAAESGDGSRLNEKVIKDFTGGDTLHARALYKSPISFIPQFKLWMYSNYKPRVKGMDYGIWRRIRLVPFTAHIDKPDKTLSQRMRVELPGIFNWALRGYQEWEKYGLKEPKAIREEVQNYREDMDLVSHFISEKCETGEGLFESTEELWEAYSRWQEDYPKGDRIYKRSFAERLVAVGHNKVKTRVNGSRNPISSHKGLKLRGRL